MTDIEPIDDEAYAADVEANAKAYETGVCPSCEQPIPPERLEVHLAGLDGARPECPRQDLEEIAERARAVESARASWGGPLTSTRGFWARAAREAGYRG